jgi:hypothetical protein
VPSPLSISRISKGLTPRSPARVSSVTIAGRKMIQFSTSKFETGISQYGVLTVQFSAPGHYLRFQRDAHFKPSTFGDIHFECDGQGWGGYDVIQDVELVSRHLRISLVPERAEDFDGRLEYDVTLNLCDAEEKEAAKSLQRLFTGTDLLRVKA